MSVIVRNVHMRERILKSVNTAPNSCTPVGGHARGAVRMSPHLHKCRHTCAHGYARAPSFACARAYPGRCTHCHGALGMSPRVLTYTPAISNDLARGLSSGRKSPFMQGREQLQGAIGPGMDQRA